MTSTQERSIIRLIPLQHCILATDLALFFPNKAKLAAMVEEEKFSWSVLEHRLMVTAMSMTAADLSASSKPWEVQTETVKGIFEEFYDQGDAERAAGRIPMAMMDRTQTDQQANSQVMPRDMVGKLLIEMFCSVAAWIFKWNLYSLLHATVPLDPRVEADAAAVPGEFDAVAGNRGIQQAEGTGGTEIINFEPLLAMSR